MAHKVTAIAAFIIMILMAGCSAKQASDAPLQPLKIGVLPVEDNLPFFIAEDGGMFGSSGLQVELVPFSSARDRDTALMSGQIDGAAADLVATALLKKGGTEVRIVSLTLGANPKEGRFALLSGPQSGIVKPEQLANIPVAISEHTIIDYVADQLMLIAGVPRDAIKKIAVPAIPDRMQMLMNGKVKAGVLPDPLATLAQSQGAVVVLDDTQSEVNLSQVVLLFSGQAITQKKQSIARLLEIYETAAQAANDNPGKYKDLFIEKARVPEPLKNTYLPPHFSPPSLPDQVDVARVMDWMTASKLTQSPYRYDDLVDTGFLRKR